MKNRRVFAAALIVAAILSAGVFALVTRGPKTPVFSLTSYEKVTFDAGLPVGNVAQLDAILSGLPKRKLELWETPEHVVSMYKSSSPEPEYLSVFLKEGYVYEGYFLDAWTESMMGKESVVYRISKKQVSELEKLLKE